jgi:hypothetical protein
MSEGTRDTSAPAALVLELRAPSGETLGTIIAAAK